MSVSDNSNMWRLHTFCFYHHYFYWFLLMLSYLFVCSVTFVWVFIVFGKKCLLKLLETKVILHSSYLASAKKLEFLATLNHLYEVCSKRSVRDTFFPVLAYSVLYPKSQCGESQRPCVGRTFTPTFISLFLKANKSTAQPLGISAVSLKSTMISRQVSLLWVFIFPFLAL